MGKAKSVADKLRALTAFRPTDFAPRVGLKLGLTDPVSGLNMGQTAEILAQEFKIAREAQDEFALRSHQRASAAMAKLSDEIVPVFLPRNGGRPVTSDNGPRANQSMADLARLRPVFERHGTVTAGNASQITDGAVALLVMGERRAAELGMRPLGVVVDYAYAGCDPARMGLGPVFAIRKLQARGSVRVQDADIVEINEAFAAQVLAVLTQLDAPIDPDRLNVNGGAIALGHPVGATGARLVLSAVKELHRRNARRALVTLCVGGGQGGALWIERN